MTKWFPTSRLNSLRPLLSLSAYNRVQLCSSCRLATCLVDIMWKSKFSSCKSLIKQINIWCLWENKAIIALDNWQWKSINSFYLTKFVETVFPRRDFCFESSENQSWWKLSKNVCFYLPVICLRLFHQPWFTGNLGKNGGSAYLQFVCVARGRGAVLQRALHTGPKLKGNFSIFVLIYDNFSQLFDGCRYDSFR